MWATAIPTSLRRAAVTANLLKDQAQGVPADAAHLEAPADVLEEKR
jgi:hypothetical protein